MFLLPFYELRVEGFNLIIFKLVSILLTTRKNKDRFFFIDFVSFNASFFVLLQSLSYCLLFSFFLSFFLSLSPSLLYLFFFAAKAAERRNVTSTFFLSLLSLLSFFLPPIIIFIGFFSLFLTLSLSLSFPTFFINRH